MRAHPDLVGHVAAAPVGGKRLLDASDRIRPRGVRHGRQRALEQHPVQAEQVAGPSRQRLQLVDDGAQLTDFAEVGAGRLETVQADEQRLLVARRAPGGRGAATLVVGLREAQPVGREHGEAGPRIRLGRSVAEHGRDAQARPQRRHAVVGREPGSHGGVPAELAERRHLQPAVACFPSGGQRGVMVGERRGVAAQCFPRAGAGHAHSTDEPGILGLLGRAPRLIQKCHGVGGGSSPRLLPGEQPGTGCAGVVTDGRGVRADGFRRGGQEVRGPPMVDGTGRGGCGGVEHLLDQVVRELVDQSDRYEHADRGRAFATACRLVRGQPQHVGDNGRVDRAAEHGAGAQQLLQLGARAGELGQHRDLQRLRHAAVACGQPAQGLHDEQRVPAGPGRDRRGRSARPARRRLGPRRRARADVARRVTAAARRPSAPPRPARPPRCAVRPSACARSHVAFRLRRGPAAHSSTNSSGATTSPCRAASSASSLRAFGLPMTCSLPEASSTTQNVPLSRTTAAIGKSYPVRTVGCISYGGFPALRINRTMLALVAACGCRYY